MDPRFTNELVTSFQSRPTNHNDYANLFLRAENKKHEKTTFQTIEDCMKNLQIAVLEKKRKVIAYLSMNQYNANTGVNCRIFFDKQNHLILYIELDLYISNIVGILKILAQIKNLILVNCLSRNIVIFDKYAQTLQIKKQNKITLDIENYSEMVVSASEFIDYVKNTNVFNIPDTLAISLPLICSACVKYPKLYCDACAAYKILRWENIFATYKFLQLLITKYVISKATLHINYLNAKYEDKIILEDNILILLPQKRNIANRIKKNIKIRWAIMQPIIRGKSQLTCLNILRYYNFDQKLTESLKYMEVCKQTKKE